MSGLPEGGVDVTVSGTFDDGHPVLLSTSFERGAATEITRAVGGDWPMFRKSPAGSSFTAASLPPPLELAWATPVPGMVALSSPVVADGRVYLGTRSETGDPASEAVTCCDALTGSILWVATVPGGVALAPAVAGNVVIASSMADSTVGLDASTGLRLWSIKTPGNRYKLAAPIVSGGTAWVGSEPQLVQIQAANGQVDWTSPLLGSSWYPGIYSAPAISSQFVYTGFYGIAIPPDGLSVLDRATGAAMYQENGVYRTPVCAGDTVWVISGSVGLGQQFLSARDALGQTVWTSVTNIGRSTAAPALGHGVIVVAGLNGTVRGFRSSDGGDLWSHAVDLSLYDMSPNRRRQRDTNATAAIADEVAYVGSLDGNLYALDLATGAELWRWYLGTPIGSSPAVSGNSGLVASGGPAPSAGRASIFTFYPPQPNPSTASVHLEWVQPHRGRVRIDVFDVAGRRVAKVLDESRDAGESFATWDGRDERGGEVAAGVYFVRLRAGETSSVRKLVRLKR